MRIAIVGGGISGLAAAHRLTELLPQAQLTLFEASEQLGGVLRTAPRDGFLVERAADNFLTTPGTAVDLCRRLGIADQLVPTNADRRRAFVVRNGRLRPIPDGFYLMSPRKLWPLLASRLLSWSGKLRLLAEPLIPAKAPSLSLASQAPSPSGRGQGEGLSADDESVASFARRRLGNEALEWLVQPLVAGIYTADPEKLSMAATLPQFVEYEREYGSLLRATLWQHAAKRIDTIQKSGSTPRHGPTPTQAKSSDDRQASGARYGLFVAPQHGMSSLVQAIAARLPAESFRLRTEVREIRPTNDGRWRVCLADQPPSGDANVRHDPPEPTGEDARALPSENKLPLPLVVDSLWRGEGRGGGELGELFDAVIIGLPSHAAAQLLACCDPGLSAELAAIPYAGCAVVSFGFARRQVGHPLDGFGLVVPQCEGRRIVSASFASQKYPGRAPAGSVLIRVFLGGALQPELLDRSNDELIAIALDELRELLTIRGEPTIADLARWSAAMPQYHVGHLERIARIEQLAMRWPRLALAGNAYRGVGVPHCVHSGELAAERIAAG